MDCAPGLIIIVTTVILCVVVFKLKQSYDSAAWQPKAPSTGGHTLTDRINAFNSQEFTLRSYLPVSHVGDAWSEFTERDMAFKFTRKDACVLEFGGGSGSVSYVIQRVLNNPLDHVVVQPNVNEMFGGLASLRQNRANQGCQYHIIDHVLQPKEASDVLELVSKPFDTLVVDCEGCLLQEYYKNPELFKHVTQVQVERDDRVGRNDYETLLTGILGFHMVFQGPHIHPSLTVEVWSK